MITKEKALDILDRMDFFQGQRAGRELWNEKSRYVQEIDLQIFREDVAELKAYIADVAPRAEVDRLERLRAELSKEVADLQDAIKCEKETNDHLCEEYMSAMREVEAMQRSFGEKLEVAEALIATLNKTTHNARQEVAREIFDEIERVEMSKIDADLSIAILDDSYYIQAIDELKKKYQIESTEL